MPFESEQQPMIGLELEELDLAPHRPTTLGSDPLKPNAAAADDVFALATLVPSWNQRLPINDNEDKDFLELFLSANRGAGFTPMIVEGNPNNHAGASDPTRLRTQIKLRLSVIELSNSHIGPGGAAMLAEYLRSPNGRCMTEMRLDCNALGDNGAQSVCQALSGAHHITVLSMEMNGITKASCVAVGRMMKRVPTLSKLYLGNNTLTDDGVAALCSALVDCSAMNEVGLSATNITATGARAVADALQHNASLTSILLNRNPLLDSGVAALCDALAARNTLRCIELADVGLHTEGCRRLADVYRVSRTLTRLVVGANEFGDDGVAALAAALRENTCLTSVEMERCCMTDVGAQALLSALTANADSRVRTLIVNENALGAATIAQLQKLGEQRKIKVGVKSAKAKEGAACLSQAPIPVASDLNASQRIAQKENGGCGCALM